MELESKTRDSGTAEECAIRVGEHVWVSGREGEYVVMGVDQKNGRLQVLRLGNTGGLETVVMRSVRVVLAPKAVEANRSAA